MAWEKDADTGNRGSVGRINFSENGDFRKVTGLDILLIVLILFFSLGIIVHTKLGMNAQSPVISDAAVYHEGKPIKTLKLEKDREISLLKGKMLLEIKDRRVRVKESECPRKICVNRGWINHFGERIICVPYKILIEFRSAGTPVLDAVVY